MTRPVGSRSRRRWISICLAALLFVAACQDNTGGSASTAATHVGTTSTGTASTPTGSVRSTGDTSSLAPQVAGVAPSVPASDDVLSKPCKSGSASPSTPDRWEYSANITAQSGLELDNVRFGPRLVADNINVAYVRVRDGAGRVHLGFLTPAARTSDTDIRTVLLRSFCTAEDGQPGVSSIFQLTVPAANGPFIVLVEQSYRFNNSVDAKCEPTETAVCYRFWPTTTWAIPGASNAAMAGVAVSIIQRFAFDPDHGSLEGNTATAAADIIRDVPHVNYSATAKEFDDLIHRHGTLEQILSVDDLGSPSNGAGGSACGIHHTGSDTRSPGSMKCAGSITVLSQGAVTNWENWHQTDRAGVGLPGLRPGVLPPDMFGGTAGCSECVHIHWSWFANLNESVTIGIKQLGLTKTINARDITNLTACGSAQCWSDGKPQILPGSEQTACLGWTTTPISTPVDFCDPTTQQTMAKVPLDPTAAPIMYWEAISNASTALSDGVRIGDVRYTVGDSYWAPLISRAPNNAGSDPTKTDRTHGGDGSMFVEPARRIPSITTTVKDGGSTKRATTATLTPVWPASAAPAPQGNFAATTKWTLPVLITLPAQVDQGPFYLRVRTSDGLRLLNPDPLYTAGSAGAPWVTVYDDLKDATGNWVFAVNRKPVATYRASAGPMVALLTFDRQPTVNDVSMQLDAAPNGVPGYIPSDGTWPQAGWSTVNWATVARSALQCSPQTGAPWDRVTPTVTFADVTGDGAKEAIVQAKCPTSTSSPPLETFIYDGNSALPNLTLLLTLGGSEYFRTMTVTPRSSGLTVSGEALSDQAPLCCPDLVISEAYVWNGFAFEGKGHTEKPLPGAVLFRTSFVTPSGNIWCAQGPDSVSIACTVRQHSFPVPSCEDSDPGVTVLLDSTGTPRLSGCANALFETAQREPVDYGSTIDMGGSECVVSAEHGVRCININGHGFQVNSASFTTF